MSSILNEITPQDFYVIKITEPITILHISNLIDLYQPIIGSDATSLYFAFLNTLPIGQAGFSKVEIHRKLISQLNLSFRMINRARKVLEAVGLLKTFKYKGKDREEFTYEYQLFSPLKPIKFFRSDILSLMLFNRIGKIHFQVIKEKYLTESNWENQDLEKEKEITKSFDEVFDSILTSEIEHTKQELDELLQTDNQSDLDPSTVKIKSNYLDMEFIKNMVNDIYQPNKKIGKEIEALLQELGFLYQLSEVNIINLLRDQVIYDDSGNIDEKRVRDRLRVKYQSQKKEVKIERKQEPHDKDEMNNKAFDSKADKHKWVLKNYSPVELLEQYQGGSKIAEADLVLVESLVYEYKLPQEVVNVLVEYVMLTNDYKLPKKLTEKIAGHWRRSKIMTVDQALALAKKEQQLYREWKSVGGKEKGKPSVRKTQTSNRKKEKIPDYILQQEQKYHQQGKDSENKEEIDNDLKDEINRLLKEIGEA